MDRPTRERVDLLLTRESYSMLSEAERDLIAEVKALREQLEDAEKRADYAWKDGYGSAEAGLSGNVDALVKAARDVVEDHDLWRVMPEEAKLERLRAALKPFEGE